MHREDIRLINIEKRLHGASIVSGAEKWYDALVGGGWVDKVDPKAIEYVTCLSMTCPVNGKISRITPASRQINTINSHVQFMTEFSRLHRHINAVNFKHVNNVQ